MSNSHATNAPAGLSAMRTRIAAMPKAELHMHLEGSLEADLMFRLARRNKIALRWPSEDALRAAYKFSCLQDFLDVYYAGLTVLLTEQDFFDMTWAYLEKVHSENVLHTEVFISPQAHTRRGVAFEAMFEGISNALRQAEERFGMSTGLLLGLQRQWSDEDAVAMIEQALPYRERVAGIGMGGPELPNPPSKFVNSFARARAEGFKTVAHAGEEGPASYVADTIDLLHVDRIDHGVRCGEDPALVARLAQMRIPLTVCPLSNLELKVFATLAEHNIKTLLHAGVAVTINSDDPSYFGGYMNENFSATQEALQMSADDVLAIARNGFEAAFLPDAAKARHIAALEAYWAGSA
jgi:adenosine deaminase